MTAPTLAPALSGAFWAMASAAPEPEFPPCPSVLRLINGDPARFAWCEAKHAETGEKAHRAEIQGHTKFWSDAEADKQEAAFLRLPKCARCDIRYVGSEFGPYCRAACRLADKHCASDHDDYETEAAA